MPVQSSVFGVDVNHCNTWFRDGTAGILRGLQMVKCRVCLIDLTSISAQIWLVGHDCQAGNLAQGVEDSQRHTQIQKHKITRNARLLI
jgi:hypothetical protein